MSHVGNYGILRHDEQRLAALEAAVQTRRRANLATDAEIGRVVQHCNEAKAAVAGLMSILVAKGIVSEGEAAPLLALTNPLEWKPTESISRVAAKLSQIVDDTAEVESEESS